MATPEVYNPTTVAEPRSTWLAVPTESLTLLRCLVKVAEVLLSLVAFIVEEVVTSCISCTALYFFEFVSCTAFLFTLLLLILLATKLREKVGISCWPRLDFGYTAVIAFFFLVASIAFAANNGQTSLEQVAVVFGFLATLAFVVDAAMFVKSNGIPWKRDGKPETSNGNARLPTHETERLNMGPNGTE